MFAIHWDHCHYGGRCAGILECCFFGGCDLGCLFIILFVASIIAMIAGVISNPLEALKALIGSIWGAITGTK